MTGVTRHYLLDFFLRLTIFLGILAVYLLAPGQLDFTQREGLSIPLMVLWVVVIGSMVVQLNPRSRLTKGCLKQYPTSCQILSSYDREELRSAVRTQNRGAGKVAVLWLLVNLVIGVLYHRGTVIRAAELVVICAFYYLCDLICVLFFCPFQYFLMKNRCCVNCRIFAWGSWMMAAPMMLIPHWYAQTLFWTGMVVLLCWEVRFFHHPERFWYGSNGALQCANCAEHLCRYKKLRPQNPM